MGKAELKRIDWNCVEIATRALRAIRDPIDTPPWDPFVDHEPLTLAMVMAEKPISYAYDADIYRRTWQKKKTHLGRIRWLIENGWHDAVSVEVGGVFTDYYRGWLYTDGNHRVAASFLRGDKYLLCSCGGSVRRLEKMFGKYINYDKAILLPKSSKPIMSTS